MIKRLDHRFVESIPQNLEEGILYVSIRFNVSMHSCACGCGNKVVTPFSPARWKMTYNGKTVSLYPSIGNWNFDCESHYWIRENEIEWAAKWTKEEIEEGKRNEKQRRADYFNKTNSIEQSEDVGKATLVKTNSNEGLKRSWWKRLFFRK